MKIMFLQYKLVIPNQLVPKEPITAIGIEVNNEFVFECSNAFLSGVAHPVNQKNSSGNSVYFLSLASLRPILDVNVKVKQLNQGSTIFTTGVLVIDTVYVYDHFKTEKIILRLLDAHLSWAFSQSRE